MEGRDEVFIRKEDNSLSLNFRNRDWIRDIGIGIPINGKWLWSYDDSLQVSSINDINGFDKLGEYKGYEITYWVKNKKILNLKTKVYKSISSIVIETKALKDIRNISIEDSFIQTTFNSPTFRVKDCEFLLYTWGLRDSKEEFPGGYWPQAIYGENTNRISENHAFAPLILFNKQATVVISPLNYYLISPLRMIDTPIGQGIARGLHGSVNQITKETITSTIFSFGDNWIKTLYQWGDILLKLGGKERISPLAHPFLKKLGYWNAFGAYYAEVFHGLNDKTLYELADYFKREKIPIGYFGLDLWYPHDKIGLAKSYKPNSEKYPQGLKEIVKKTDIPLVLHLSAFDKNNEYSKKYSFISDGKFSCPASKNFYIDLARNLKEEGAAVIWHDWLHTQQHLMKQLRGIEADKRFDDMSRAFEEKDLKMMPCMPTMGFHLASASHQNIIATRSYEDYLFKQGNQVKMLGEVKKVKPQKYIKNNILVGMVIHALGMYPFYDVFITNKNHPEGFEEPDAEQEALLRALSSGPVGIGDKIGKIDTRIINKLCFSDGVIAKPDHPPYVPREYLGSDILVSYTESVINKDVRWIYLTVFNVGEKKRNYSVDTEKIYAAEHIIYDYFGGKLVDDIKGILAPAKGHYYILVPKKKGLAFLGFMDKYATAPSSNIKALKFNEGSCKVIISAPPGHSYSLAAYSAEKLKINAKEANILKVENKDGLYFFGVKPMKRDFEIYMRKLTEGKIKQ